MRSLTRERGYSSHEVGHGYESFFVDVEDEKKVAVGCDIIYEEKMTNNTAYVNGEDLSLQRSGSRKHTQENTYGKLFCCQ